jgi:hypothetical protein
MWRTSPHIEILIVKVHVGTFGVSPQLKYPISGQFYIVTFTFYCDYRKCGIKSANTTYHSVSPPGVRRPPGVRE